MDCEDKENSVSRTPTKPMEIAPSISNIEKCSAIQMATAVLKIESASGECTTIATSMTTITNGTGTPENSNVVNPVKQSGGKSNPLLRIRTNSNASSTADKASKNSTPNSSSSQSLVKKTIAKVTAAFKTSSKPVAAPGPVDHNSLRSRLTSKKSNATNATGYTRHDGPLRVEYEKPSNGARVLSPSNQSSATNRRCSSVPRTLREKQALVRSGAIAETDVHVAPPTATTTLGEKIQNFFSSSHSNNLNMVGSSASSSKSQRQNSVKAKENPVKGEFDRLYNSQITVLFTLSSILIRFL